jgi:hypothetical protein
MKQLGLVKSERTSERKRKSDSVDALLLQCWITAIFFICFFLFSGSENNKRGRMQLTIDKKKECCARRVWAIGSGHTGIVLYVLASMTMLHAHAVDSYFQLDDLKKLIQDNRVPRRESIVKAGCTGGMPPYG